MKVVQINSVAKGSTGTIMLNIGEMVRKNGGQCITFSQPRGNSPNIENHIFFGSILGHFFHRGINAISGFSDVCSVNATRKLLKELDDFKPDIVHLHNLHGWYINLPMLFQYIKKNRVPVVWTLHDCWSFTGHCPYFTIVNCDKWKTGCYQCPSYRYYPQSFVDNSRYMYRLKRKWFTGLEDMTIVTPSQWLADLVKESFLKNYPVKVINNGINLYVFKPTESSFREKYSIPASKKIVLGVAFDWGKRKGLDVFIELASRLDYEKYQIVLVGTDDVVDKQLPENVISIHRTQDPNELAEIYTAADVFVNPTREENYPTVNMEAIACGTPVLTFNTGGSPEILNKQTGSVVNCDDVDAMESEIARICDTEPYSKEDCMLRAKQFDKHLKYKEYISLYESKTNN